MPLPNNLVTRSSLSKLPRCRKKVLVDAHDNSIIYKISMLDCCLSIVDQQIELSLTLSPIAIVINQGLYAVTQGHTNWIRAVVNW